MDSEIQEIVEFDTTGYKETLIHVEILRNANKCPPNSPWTYIETKPNQFTCRYCHKSFNKQYVLKRHIATHTGEKAFKCTACPMAFIQKSDLMRHVTIHSDERPFKCEIAGCDKSFRTMKNLRNHIVNSQHLIKEYRCDVCGEINKTKPDFEKHLRMHKYLQLQEKRKQFVHKLGEHRNLSYDRSIADKFLRNPSVQFVKIYHRTERKADTPKVVNKPAKEKVDVDEEVAYEFVDENEFLSKEQEILHLQENSEETDKSIDFEISFELKEEPAEEPSCVIETGDYRFETDWIKKEDES